MHFHRLHHCEQESEVGVIQAWFPAVASIVWASVPSQPHLTNRKISSGAGASSVITGIHLSSLFSHRIHLAVTNWDSTLYHCSNYSGSKALSSLRTVLDIDRLVERLMFCQFMASTTETRSWNKGSIFTLSFALIWGPVVALCSDSPPSAWLFKNFHQSALYKRVKHFTIRCKRRPRNW